MTFGAPTVTGRPAIRQGYADRFAMGTATTAIRSDELQLMGDWAFDRGTFTATMMPSGGGDSVTVEGRYLVILRKQADGSWKLARAIDNSPSPAGQ
jgi:ketosteroid isomerase-like protein